MSVPQAPAQTFVLNNSITRAYSQGPPPVIHLCATFLAVINSTISYGVLRYAFRVGAASAAQTFVVNNSITRAYKGPPSVTHLCATCRAVIKSTMSYGMLRFAFRVGAASAAETFVVNTIITRAYTGATSSHPPMCNVPGCDHYQPLCMACCDMGSVSVPQALRRPSL